MGNAAAAAIANMTDAQAMPVCAPNGTARCPGGVVRIGVFFDGTDNNMYRDAPNDLLEYAANPLKDNGRSNVAKIWELYIEEGTLQKRIYCHGVGTDSFQEEYRKQERAKRPEIANPTEEQNQAEERAELSYGTTEVQNDTLGNATGRGGRSRIEWGRMQLADFYSNFGNDIAIEKLFDTYGFSRGAALARDFVNKVRTQGIDNLKKPNGFHVQGRRRTPIYERHVPPTPTFLGVWDTVGSFGLGGPQWADERNGYDFFVDHTYVKKTVHLIAEDEVRINFPVTSLFMDPDDEGTRGSGGYQDPDLFKDSMVEIWYPGAHCDVGGAYVLRHEIAAVPAHTTHSSTGRGMMTTRVVPAKPAEPGKRPDLAHIPLRDMHTGSIKAKVPLRPLESLSPAKLWEVPGDLAEWYSKYDDYRADKDYAVKKRYIHTLPSRHFERDTWDPRRAQENFQKLKLHFIHDSADEFMFSFIDNHRSRRTVHFMGRQPTTEGPAVR